MNKNKGSPRKFSEKIALLNRKEAEANAEFEKIIKEVEETTRAPATITSYPSRASSSSSWIDARQYDDQSISDTFMPHDIIHNQNGIIHQNTSTCDTQQVNHHQQQPHLHHQHQISTQMSVQTPENMPNINIFPIDDDHYQQQVTLSTSYRSDCSNPISAARSLPDIANLRVSGLSTAMAPSYSDRRIPNEYNYNYDDTTNDNITQPGSNHHHHHHFTNQPNHNQSQHHHHHQQQQQNLWHQSDYNQHQQNQNSLHQDYYSSQGPGTAIVRANSTNAVLSSWHNTDTLNAPRVNANLSKSSDICYAYQPEDQTDGIYSNSYNVNINQQHQDLPNYRMRSSSYNNIENINFQDDLKTARQAQQQYQLQHQSSEQHQLQPIYAETQQYQFYE